MFASPSKSLSRIREQSARMRAIVASRELSAAIPRSAWCVAEHLDHTIKVASSTIQVLLKPTLPALPYGINFMGRMVLTSGWIPRGRGNAPEKLRGMPATKDELIARLTELDVILERTAATSDRDATPVLRHPLFGGLSFSQSLEFLVIHTNHHLKIIA
jgi:hypothetical protein